MPQLTEVTKIDTQYVIKNKEIKENLNHNKKKDSDISELKEAATHGQ